VRSEEDALKGAKDQVIRTKEDLENALRATSEAIEKNPQDTKLLAKMGDLCRQKGDSEEAKRYYEKVLAIDPNNYNAAAKAADIDIARLGKAVDEAKAAYEANQSDQEARAGYKAARKEKLLFEIKEYERRIKAQPTDMSLRYRVGLLYFEGGAYDQAIANFQRAKNDPKIRNKVNIILGRSFIKKDQPDLAISQLSEMIDGRLIMDEDKKTALYYRAKAFKAYEKYEEARKDLETIYLDDIGFMDVADKIKEIDDLLKNAGPGGQG
jgi:tetratricopeptide (TPR) repeat protein